VISISGVYLIYTHNSGVVGGELQTVQLLYKTLIVKPLRKKDPQATQVPVVMNLSASAEALAFWASSFLPLLFNSELRLLSSPLLISQMPHSASCFATRNTFPTFPMELGYILLPLIQYKSSAPIFPLMPCIRTNAKQPNVT
jgi:hypothetical protein